MYIRQRTDWPNFRFDSGALTQPLARARLEQGKVVGALLAIGLRGSTGVERELWTEEAMSTAAIEGEKRDLAVVRSSVMRRLGEQDAGRRANRHVDGLLDVRGATRIARRDPMARLFSMRVNARSCSACSTPGAKDSRAA